MTSDEELRALMAKARFQQAKAQAEVELAKPAPIRTEALRPNNGYDQAKAQDHAKADRVYDHILSRLEGLPKRVQQPTDHKLAKARKDWIKR